MSKPRPSHGEQQPAPGGWFKVLNRLVDDRWLARLGHAELLVWLAFSRFAAQDGTAYPTAETVANRTGLNVRSVHRALATLTKKALLVTRNAGGGRGRSAERLVMIPRTETLSAASGISPTNPDTALPETLTVASTNPDTALPETLTPTPPHKDSSKRPEKKTINNTTPAAAADVAGGGGSSSKGEEGEEEQTRVRELFEAFRIFGIRGKARDDIAAIPGMTAGVVGEVAADVERDGGRTGVLVTTLRDDGAHLVRAHREKAEAAALRELERQAQEAERQARAAEQKALYDRCTAAYHADPGKFDAGIEAMREARWNGHYGALATSRLGLAHAYNGDRMPDEHKPAIKALAVELWENRNQKRDQDDDEDTFEAPAPTPAPYHGRRPGAKPTAAERGQFPEDPIVLPKRRQLPATPRSMVGERRPTPIVKVPPEDTSDVPRRHPRNEVHAP